MFSPILRKTTLAEWPTDRFLDYGGVDLVGKLLNLDDLTMARHDTPLVPQTR